MRASAGSSIRSSGPTRRWTLAPRRPEASLLSTVSVEEGLQRGSGKGGKEIGPGLRLGGRVGGGEGHLAQAEG